MGIADQGSHASHVRRGHRGAVHAGTFVGAAHLGSVDRHAWGGYFRLEHAVVPARSAAGERSNRIGQTKGVRAYICIRANRYGCVIERFQQNAIAVGHKAGRQRCRGGRHINVGIPTRSMVEDERTHRA